MTQIHVRRIDSTVAAVHTSDEDWRDVVRGWVLDTGQIEDEQQFGDFLRGIEKVNATMTGQVWLLNSPTGISVVEPAVFVDLFEDVNATEVLDEVWLERQGHKEKGYDAAHDDKHGLGHLLEQAVSHLSHFGEAPTDEFIRGEIIVAASLLIAAVDQMDRGNSKGKKILPGFYTHKELGRLELKWTQRVSEYLGELDDLAGTSQDEIDVSTPEEAITWASERFKVVFGIKDED